ncbi:hypothetical protein BUALT_BualtUnG0029900 [Buddleja alternifolia]|uniref:Uncharacterized protein n=1 Tax=Buddleja alternifolia TaxID=168488 RepID=A0AAV6W3L0_9LAMI|nr:hypothetical protein BUALT_BualtUnG0029900 [Buddleja alternifolia]
MPWHHDLDRGTEWPGRVFDIYARVFDDSTRYGRVLDAFWTSSLPIYISHSTRFMVIPDMLKNAPMFKRLESRIKGKGSALGVGRGRAVAMRARVSSSSCSAL